jgi:hypothetical protein
MGRPFTSGSSSLRASLSNGLDAQGGQRPRRVTANSSRCQVEQVRDLSVREPFVVPQNNNGALLSGQLRYVGEQDSPVRVADGMIRHNPVVHVDRASSRNKAPRAAPCGPELVQNHLADVELRSIQHADSASPGMGADQDFLDNVLAADAIPGQDSGEAQQRRQVPVHELIEGQRASALRVF